MYSFCECIGKQNRKKDSQKKGKLSNEINKWNGNRNQSERNVKNVIYDEE